MGDRGMAVTASPAPSGAAAGRVALCIGVSQYATSPLKNTAHDASDVADLLRSVGFDATLLLEPSVKQMLDALEAVVASLRPGGTAVFFFAGMSLPGSDFVVRQSHAMSTHSDSRAPNTQATARRRRTAATSSSRWRRWRRTST
jgi:uncharacterized caspase-like protein